LSDLDELKPRKPAKEIILFLLFTKPINLMKTLNSYLTFNGNCEEAFNFYKSVFGGEFSYLGRFSEMPGAENVPEGAKNKIMHISLQISKETMLMGSDASEEYGTVVSFGDNISLYIGADTHEEVKSIFEKLSAGGTITMPLDKTFWSPLFGMLTDKFGINWMVSVEEEMA
jgi:PhnB protein